MSEKESKKDEEILKEEQVGFLKNWIQLLNGRLYMTPTHLVCEARRSAGRVALPFIRRWIEKDKGFKIPYLDITEVLRGRHGVEKNVLQVINKDGKKYRIMVKNYEEWETAIKEKIGR